MPYPLLSRRSFLTGSAATLAAPGIAFGQSDNSLDERLRQLFGEPRRPQQAPIQPPVAGQPVQPGQQGFTPALPPDAEQWFVESVPDGPFEIRKVNFDMLNPEFRRQLVPYSGPEQPGTLVVDPERHFLFSVREGGEAVRYGVGVGREGFGWSGRAQVGRKAEWPDWHPPKEMRLRQPELPEKMPGGPGNPLGARALYLYEGNRDTLYRIHGTFEPWTIGQSVSSGCIRMLDEEVVDLYLRTPIGTRVVVL